jgi:hypothetical protein
VTTIEGDEHCSTGNRVKRDREQIIFDFGWIELAKNYERNLVTA